jgi:RNA recognition motif-containing protein
MQYLEFNNQPAQTTSNTYHGRTFFDIERIVNGYSWHPFDKTRFLNNVQRVIEITTSNKNTHELKYLFLSNFKIVQSYIETTWTFHPHLKTLRTR